MNKHEVAHTLSSQTGLSKAEATRFVRVFFELMATAMVRGDRVDIRNLWSFKVKDYPGYTARNPKTGERVEIVPKKLPFFRCGKDLKDRMNH